MRVNTKCMSLACCSAKMNTFCNSQGSWQPSRICLVPRVAQGWRIANLPSWLKGHIIYMIQQKNLTRLTISRFHTVYKRAAIWLIHTFAWTQQGRCSLQSACSSHLYRLIPRSWTRVFPDATPSEQWQIYNTIGAMTDLQHHRSNDRTTPPSGQWQIYNTIGAMTDLQHHQGKDRSTTPSGQRQIYNTIGAMTDLQHHQGKDRSTTPSGQWHIYNTIRAKTDLQHHRGNDRSTTPSGQR